MHEEQSRPRAQGKRKYVVLKPFYEMGSSAPIDGAGARATYTVVIAIRWGHTLYEPLTRIQLSATQAADLLTLGVVRLDLGESSSN
jgi:hypothetical protein